jgi:hypothetical protein
MVVVLYFGFGFAALRNANNLWASATYTLAIATIAAALVGALVRNGVARTAWIGLAAFGWAYLLASRLPDLTSYNVGKLAGPCLLIEWMIALFAPHIYPPGTPVNWPAFDQVSHSLGMILFALLGAVVGRLLAVKNGRTNVRFSG